MLAKIINFTPEVPMHEDEVLNQAVADYKTDGWQLIYRTRPIAEGAIGGVDAILMKRNPWRFVFIDAKGCAETKEKRSSGFTNCLGALLNESVLSMVTPATKLSIDSFQRESSPLKIAVSV